jgi:triphosphatase
MTKVPASAGDLAVLVLQRNAADFVEHAPGARVGSDPYHVHQMRVATRRMRAAVRLFADVLPTDASSLNDELKWFASQLGSVRDLDVQIHRLRDTAAALCITDAIAPYIQWLEGQHHGARTELGKAFEARRFGVLVQVLQRVDAWPLPDSPAVCADAPRRLRRVFKQFRKRADAVDEQAPTSAIHAVRIGGKRLRYTAEFYELVYGKPARRLAEQVVTLQDLLGNLQDGVVSRQHIHEAVESSAGAWSAHTTLALGQLVQFEAEREKELRAAFPHAYRSVRHAWQELSKALR